MPTRSGVRAYMGAEVKAAFDLDRTRSSVPDDPVRMPPNGIACEACGVAVGGPAILSVPVGGAHPMVSVEYGRCRDCQRVYDLVKDEPARAAMFALAAIGLTAANVEPLVPWLASVGSSVRWLNPDAPVRGLANATPWGHVSIGHRAQIKEALALGLRSRVPGDSKPVQLPPPWRGGCLFCGVGSVAMSPLEVARHGGREVAGHTVWRGVVVQANALGGSAAQVIDGFVCGVCAESVDASDSIRVACTRAFEQHARKQGLNVPTGLANLYNGGRPVTIPGWASLGTTTPNRTPWAHIAVDELAS